ncbi:MAG: hypothetical protein INR73_17115 [Williamsia sp.]|nr:hypothetical protein [Williamsia sp.]
MKTLCRYLLVALLFSICKSSASAQQIQPDLLKVRLLKDSILLEENQFAFNNISLLNNSASTLHIQLTLLPPDAVDIVSATVTNIEIKPHESQTVPFRFTQGKKNASIAWYPVAIELRIAESGQVINRAFYVKPKENTKWRVLLRQPTITFLETDKEIPFDVYIENTGNSDDVYTFTINTPLDLSIPKKNYTVMLPPGGRQTVSVKVLLTPKDIWQLKREDIEIFVKGKNSEQKMLRQTVIKMGYSYNGAISSWYKMPLSVELNLNNIASNQPFGFVNLRGYLPLKGDAQLNMLFQSDNIYRSFSANTHLATAQYVKGPWRITGGSIVDFNNFLVDGMGARLQYNGPDNQLFELMGVKSRRGNTHQFNMKFARRLGGRWSFSSNSFVNRDIEKKTDSYLTINRLDWLMGAHTKLSVEGGAGMEKLNRVKLDTTLPAIQGGYHFESTGKYYQINSQITLYSKNFPGINKGFTYQLHEARFLLNHFFAGPYMELNKRAYNNTEDSLVNYLFNIDTKEWGARTGFQGKKFSMVLSPGLFTQIQDSLNSVRADMYKVSVNTNWQISDNWWFSLFSNVGKVYVPGAMHPAFYSMNNLMNLQSHRYGLTVRYDNGPYYYYEIKQYLSRSEPVRRLQIAPFAEQPFSKWNLFYRLQLNYLRETASKTSYLVAYNNLLYSSPRLGLDAGLTAQVNLINQGTPYINLTIRQRLQMPVARNKKSKNFKFVLFQDSNNNGLYDKGEEPVRQARTGIDNDVVLSNERGEIDFRNTDKTSFLLDFSQISTLRGWIPKLGYRQTIAPGSQKINYIPFLPGKMLTGKLVLVRDEKSNVTMQLDGIRITAISVDGKTYATLTNAEGEFFLNLPAAEYTVTINQEAFDENFRPSETSKSVDLVNNNLLNIQFDIRQKKRQINIHKGS